MIIGKHRKIWNSVVNVQKTVPMHRITQNKMDMIGTWYISTAIMGCF